VPGPNARYWELDGVRFCFTITPSFECPMTVTAYEVWDPVTDKTTVTTRRPPKEDEALGITFKRHVTEAQIEAARLLGVDAKALVTLIENSHRGAWHSQDGIRRRVEGKLTDLCRTCGAKLINHGYSAFVERDFDPEVDEDPEGTRKASRAISDRLGFQPPAVRLKGVNGLKRTEARKWAYEQYTQAKTAREEESSGSRR
jgi:hypothetical protein